MIEQLFIEFAGIIIFFHVISGAIWIGGMIAIRFSVHVAMQNIEDPETKLKIILNYLKNFLAIIRPVIGLLLVTAIFMIFGFNFTQSGLNSVVYTKLVLWLIMTVLFIIIQLKRNKAQILFDNKDFKNAKQTLAPLSMFIIPVNIILGIIALYLGITLRGF